MKEKNLIIGLRGKFDQKQASNLIGNPFVEEEEMVNEQPTEIKKKVDSKEKTENNLEKKNENTCNEEICYKKECNCKKCKEEKIKNNLFKMLYEDNVKKVDQFLPKNLGIKNSYMPKMIFQIEIKEENFKYDFDNYRKSITNPTSKYEYSLRCMSENNTEIIVVEKRARVYKK